MHLETLANLCARRHQANIFCSLIYFWVERYSKILNVWPHGIFLIKLVVIPSNSKSCFPLENIEGFGDIKNFSLPCFSHSFKNALKGSKEVVCSTYQNLQTFRNWMHLSTHAFKNNEYIMYGTLYKEKINTQFDCQWF